jgi:hypothetical protein
MEALSNFVADSVEGERNARLYWAACRFVEMLMPGAFDLEDAELLVDAAGRAGTPAEEAERTARSGLATAQRDAAP